MIADWRDGERRGVIGSPHFFAPGGNWFCPASRSPTWTASCAWPTTARVSTGSPPPVSALVDDAGGAITHRHLTQYHQIGRSPHRADLTGIPSIASPTRIHERGTLSVCGDRRRQTVGRVTTVVSRHARSARPRRHRRHDADMSSLMLRVCRRRIRGHGATGHRRRVHRRRDLGLYGACCPFGSMEAQEVTRRGPRPCPRRGADGPDDDASNVVAVRVRGHAETMLLVVAVTLLAVGGALYLAGFRTAAERGVGGRHAGRDRAGRLVGDRRGPRVVAWASMRWRSSPSSAHWLSANTWRAPSSRSCWRADAPSKPALAPRRP